MECASSKTVQGKTATLSDVKEIEKCDFDNFVKAVSEHCLNYNIIVCRHASESKSRFDKTPLVKKYKGFFYCQKMKKTCTFRVNFSYDYNKCIYKVNKICLEHTNHLPGESTVGATAGRTFVLYKKQFLEAELNLLRTLAHGFLDIAAIKDLLGNKFPGRTWDTRLLQRTMKDARLSTYQEGDEQSLKGFSTKSLLVNQNGGKMFTIEDFNYNPPVISGMSFQTSMMNFWALRLKANIELYLVLLNTGWPTKTRLSV